MLIIITICHTLGACDPPAIWPVADCGPQSFVDAFQAVARTGTYQVSDHLTIECKRREEVNAGTK